MDRRQRWLPTSERIHLDVFQLGILWQSTPVSNHSNRSSANILVERFDDAKQRDDDIDRRITRVPQLVQLLHGRLNLPLLAESHQILHDDWVWLVAHFEHVFTAHKPESGMGRLEVIDGLSHIPFASEDECFETIFVVLDL